MVISIKNKKNIILSGFLIFSLVLAIQPFSVRAQTVTPNANHVSELFSLLTKLKSLILQVESVGAQIDTQFAVNILNGVQTKFKNLSQPPQSTVNVVGVAPVSIFRPAGKRSSPPPVSTPEAAPATYTVGGTFEISENGLTVAMQLNGANDLSIDADGSFTFDAQLQTGDSYAITFITLPDGYECFEYNDVLSGTIEDQNVQLQIICSNR